jgi:glycosyltransferase involved in cell wall biosynthesis
LSHSQNTASFGKEAAVFSISIITVVRNGASVIANCIESVLAQQIEGMEYIVIDGASTDGTLEIIRRYGGAITVCLSEPDGGLYDAMNKGLRLARGRYVHFLNADDHYVATDTLRKLLPQLDEHTVCYGAMIYQEEDGRQRRLGSPFSWDRELMESHIPQPTLFVPSQLYREVGEFNLEYRIAADYDMVLRLAKRFPVRFVDQPVTLMMAGGISYTQMGRTFKEAARVSIRHGRPALAAYLTYLRHMLVWQIARRLPPLVIEVWRRIRSRQ